MARLMKNVYVVDPDTGEIIDIANDEKTIKKRISLKKEPYPEGSLFLRVIKKSPLASLETDEQIGYDILEKAIIAAIASGVPVASAIGNLQKSCFIVQADIAPVKKENRE